VEPVEPGSAVVDKGAGRGLVGVCCTALSGMAKSLVWCTPATSVSSVTNAVYLYHLVHSFES
jgi:hypothetical protein